MNKPLLSLSLSALSLGLVGCSDDPPTPAEVREKIATDLAFVITETDAAGQGTADAMPSEAGMSMIDRMLAQSDTEIAARMRAKMTAVVVERELKDAIARLANPEDPVDEADPAAELVSFLNEEIFTDANHVGAGVYKVPAELVCTTQELDDAGNLVEQLDAECAADFEAAQVRIRVTTDDDAMRFALQVTEQKEEPLALTLEPKSVALTLDLDDAWRTAVAFAQIAGEDLPNAELSGQVTGKLAIRGAAHAEVSLAIDRDVSIALAQTGQDLGGAEAFRFTTKQAPAFALGMNGPARRGTIVLGVAETYVHVPPLFEDATAEPGRAFELELAGLTADATFAQGEPLAVSNISLGDRDLVTKLGGQVATRIALNPADGRRFDLTLTDDAATGRATIDVSPKADIHTFTDHAVTGSAPEPYDVTRVTLVGSLSTAGGETVKVESGTYAIETNPASYGFSASAGQCVTATESYDETTGSYYTAYAVGACL